MLFGRSRTLAVGGALVVSGLLLSGCAEWAGTDAAPIEVPASAMVTAATPTTEQSLAIAQMIEQCDKAFTSCSFMVEPGQTLPPEIEAYISSRSAAQESALSSAMAQNDSPPEESGDSYGEGRAQLLRSYFTHETDASFDAVCAEALEPQAPDDGDYPAGPAAINCVEDEANDGRSAEDLGGPGWDEDSDGEFPSPAYYFVADERTLTDPTHPVLVVDRVEEAGRSFRAAPAMLWDIDANLSIGNMWFSEFADAADAAPGGVLHDLG
ncbi:DUF6924 domain-containing protein [Nakamurella alba]